MLLKSPDERDPDRLDKPKGRIMSKGVGGWPRGAVAEGGSSSVPDTSRWVAKRKAEVIAAVESGALTMREACDRYQLAPEELISWQRATRRNGITGLGATSIRLERQKREDRNS
ncbi:DUF1153 domain-containing protein [Novosphingobium chloroacetimidivorans]|uniref:DUF1153 domain-containing protein n=1 Tax=Novosphingobium chloroacetimidivorans TaxID=1428314 RepID=UPI0028ADFC61|nr:DUF1153 domain-containing protein [Novosphingobium chloroacetimidivorans]